VFRTLEPEKVYITEDVYEDSRSAACVERLMSAVEPGATERVSYDALDAVAAERWRNVPLWGSNPEPRDPDLVLTTAKFLPEDEAERIRQRWPNLQKQDLWGLHNRHWRRDGEAAYRRERKGCICQSAWELHSVRGCPFRCAYCWFGGVIRMFVNMHEYAAHLDEICALRPAQRLYKWDNESDVSCFEPEWGASRLLVDYFAEKPGKYLQIYTGKSDNVDDLLGLDHRGKTIIQWSISPRTQSTLIERETAPWDRRVEAARRCGQAGYTVRFRFSPIIPVRNWREEYAELIEMIFARTRPDVISLCAFGWMDVARARSCLDFEMLAPEFVAAMDSAAPFLAARGFGGGGGRPIPHDARAVMFKFLIDEIRKHDRRIPVSLCLETVEMWALFARELGMSPNPRSGEGYYCNCGPACTPEHAYAQGVTPGESWF
jgi:hypothetical protein